MTWFVLKLTVLLTSGAMLAALLRNRSAATRHFAWALTLIGTLLFAVAAAVGPRMRVEVPEWAATPAVKRVTAVSPSTVTVQPSLLATKIAPAQPRATDERKTFVPARFLTLPNVWMAGVALMMAWLLAGHLGLARIAGRGEAAPWTSLIDDAVARSGVKRPVRVALSEAVLAPLTWGWRHPTILLPADAASWPADRQRAALMHELAHIARNDYLTQLFASLACALYWFHPFAWFSLRRLRREGEQASDDRVIARGLRAPDYATHLVDVAVAARARRFGGLLALSMACPSHLETRLRALLDETRARNGVSRRVTVMAVAIAAIVLLSLAAARPELRAATRPGIPVAKTIDLTRTVDRMQRAWTRPVGRALQTIERVGSIGTSRTSLAPRSVNAAPGETLVLDLETGGRVEVTGWSEPRVSVDARLGGRDVADTRVDVERVGEGVRVVSKYVGTRSSRSSSHEFVIRVPGRFNVSIDSAGGGLSIENVEGLFRGSTGGGDLNLKGLKGRAELSTGGGQIDVRDAELDGEVSTGGGSVTLSNVRGGLNGSSGSEPVIRIGQGSDSDSESETHSTTRSSTTVDTVTTYMDDAPKVRQRVDHRALQISKAGGDVALDDAPHGAVIHTGGGDIHIGTASGVVDARTGGGRVEIGPVAGSVRASTGAGNVVVTLVDPAGAEQDVEIFTGSGDVEVVLPASLDARFEVETAYTRKNAPTHIDSTWELDHHPTTGWESHEGTARRYVRAQGKAGNGRGLIRIKAVNGNVTLRRGR